MSKKIMIMIAAMVLVLAFGGSAMAGGPSTSLPASSTSFMYSLSSAVSCSYAKDAAAVNYVMNCKNQSGNRIFSASNATSKLYYKENDLAYAASGGGYVGATIFQGAALTDAIDTAGATDANYDGGSWTAL